MRFPAHIRRPICVALFAGGNASSGGGPVPGDPTIPVITDPPVGGDPIVWDDYETYNLDDPIGGGDDGFRGRPTVNWDGPWISAPIYIPGWLGLESVLSGYPDGSTISGKSGGEYWSAIWVSREHAVPTLFGDDSFNSIFDGASLDGQSTGTYWSANWVAR